MDINDNGDLIVGVYGNSNIFYKTNIEDLT